MKKEPQNGDNTNPKTNMHKNILLSTLLLWLVGLSTIYAQTIDPIAQKTQKLMENIELKLKDRPGWDNPAMAIENPHVLVRITDFIELEKVVATGWPQITSNLELVAPDDVAKAILFMAFQTLPEEEYLKFLQQAVGKTEAGLVNKQLLKWALTPFGKGLRGVVSLNYEKPITQDIIRRVKILYANDGNMSAYYNDVLSGETKKAAEKYLRDNPQEARSDPARRHIFHDLPESPHALPKAKATLFPLWMIFGVVAVTAGVVGYQVYKKRKESCLDDTERRF